LIWLWVGIESETKNIVAIYISKERKICFCSIERFLDGVTKEYGRHPVSTDDGGIWYPQKHANF
jgi:putative transposase